MRMPLLNLSGQAVHLNDDLTLDLNGKRDQFATLLGLSSSDVLGDWNFVLQQQNFWSVDLGLKYPVFTGGKINAAIKVADLKSQIKDQEVTKEQNSLLTELTTRYFQFQLANEAVEVRRQALEGTKEHWDNALKLEKNGMKASVESFVITSYSIHYTKLYEGHTTAVCAVDGDATFGDGHNGYRWGPHLMRDIGHKQHRR